MTTYPAWAALAAFGVGAAVAGLVCWVAGRQPSPPDAED